MTCIKSHCTWNRVCRWSGWRDMEVDATTILKEEKTKIGPYLQDWGYLNSARCTFRSYVCIESFYSRWYWTGDVPRYEILYLYLTLHSFPNTFSSRFRCISKGPITSITLLDSFWSKNKVKTRNIDKVVLITVFRGQDQELVVHTTTLRDTAHFYFVRTQIICQTFQVPLTLFFPITHEPYHPSFSLSSSYNLIPFHFIYHPPTTFHIVVVTNILSFPTTLHTYFLLHTSNFFQFSSHILPSPHLFLLFHCAQFLLLFSLPSSIICHIHMHLFSFRSSTIWWSLTCHWNRHTLHSPLFHVLISLHPFSTPFFVSYCSWGNSTAF